MGTAPRGAAALEATPHWRMSPLTSMFAATALLIAEAIEECFVKERQLPGPRRVTQLHSLTRRAAAAAGAAELVRCRLQQQAVYMFNPLQMQLGTFC